MRNKQTEKSNTSGLFESGKKAARAAFWHRKSTKIVIIAFVGLVVFAIATAIFLKLSPTQGPQAVSDTDEAKAIATVQKIYKVSSESDKIVSEKGYQGGSDWFAGQVAATSNKEDQVVYYSQWSQSATNNGQLNDALTYAQKAEDLDQSASTAALLANAAYASGSRDLALKYYKLAIYLILTSRGYRS